MPLKVLVSSLKKKLLHTASAGKDGRILKWVKQVEILLLVHVKKRNHLSQKVKKEENEEKV